jgi:hypothetical protein
MRRRDRIQKSPLRGQHNLNPEGTSKEKDYDHFNDSSYDVRMESFPKKEVPRPTGPRERKTTVCYERVSIMMESSTWPVNPRAILSPRKEHTMTEKNELPSNGPLAWVNPDGPKDSRALAIQLDELKKENAVLKEKLDKLPMTGSRAMFESLKKYPPIPTTIPEPVLERAQRIAESRAYMGPLRAVEEGLLILFTMGRANEEQKRKTEKMTECAPDAPCHALGEYLAQCAQHALDSLAATRIQCEAVGNRIEELQKRVDDAERMTRAANEDLNRAVKERDEALQQGRELRIRCTALEDALCPERLKDRL